MHQPVYFMPTALYFIIQAIPADPRILALCSNGEMNQRAGLTTDTCLQLTQGQYEEYLLEDGRVLQAVPH